LVSQLKTLTPVLMKTLKSTMLIGRSPDFVRDFEAMLSTLMAEMESTTTNSPIKMAMVYAPNFNAQELHSGLLCTPTGQKSLERLPAITQQSMTLRQALDAKIAEDLKQRMIDAMRKKGYNKISTPMAPIIAPINNNTASQ
jgi:uncharacterized protein